MRPPDGNAEKANPPPIGVNGLDKSVEGPGRQALRAIQSQVNQASLTLEHERRLLGIVRTATDERTRQSAFVELWESHSKLVVAIARRYRRAGIDLLDLIGAGHLGLHTAIARFQPENFDTRLSTYAIGWIRWTVQDYIRRNSGPVRLPASAAHRQLFQMSGRLLADARRSCHRERVEATEAELWARVGRRIGLSADEVARSMNLMQGGALSLHAGGSDDPSAPRLEDTLADEGASPEDAVILQLDHAKARKRIMTLAHEILGERERAVFLARCMTDGDEIVHLDALAREFGVSCERVYQLEASAKQKIATALAAEGFTDFARDGQTFRAPRLRARRRRAAPMAPPEGAPSVPSLAEY